MVDAGGPPIEPVDPDAVDAPRPNRVRRILVRVLGVVAVFFGLGFVGEAGRSGPHNLLIGLAFYVLGFALLLSPWARRRTDIPPGHVPLRRVMRWILAGVGAGLLIWSAYLATTTVHPHDPLFISTQASCGSAFQPRRFPAIGAGDFAADDKQGGLVSFLAASDCGDAIGDQRSFALQAAQAGILLLWATLWRPLPADVGDPGQTADRRRLVTHPWVIAGLAAVAGLCLAVGLVTGRQTDHDTREAERTDRAAAQWLATYPPKLALLDAATYAVVSPLKAHDFAALEPKCQHALQVTSSLDGAADALPAGMGSRLRVYLRAFVDNTHEGFAACVTGSQRQDWSYLEAHMRPAITRAAGLAQRVVRLAKYR